MGNIRPPSPSLSHYCHISFHKWQPRPHPTPQDITLWCYHWSTPIYLFLSSVQWLRKCIMCSASFWQDFYVKKIHNQSSEKRKRSVTTNWSVIVYFECKKKNSGMSIYAYEGMGKGAFQQVFSKTECFSGQALSTLGRALVVYVVRIISCVVTVWQVLNISIVTTMASQPQGSSVIWTRYHMTVDLYILNHLLEHLLKDFYKWVQVV